jgi:hypothetical protein
MDNYTKHLLLNELDKLASSINIPILKSKDYNWILRNLMINNKNNKTTQKILQICQLLKKGEDNGI